LLRHHARAYEGDAGRDQRHGAALEMAMNLLAGSEGQITGTYVMPSFGRYELAAELVRRLRAREAATKKTQPQRGESK
jgi:hypothetical protein